VRSTIDTNFGPARILRSQTARRLAASALLVVAVAGCAATSAAKPPKTVAHVQATPVPTVLVAYGSAAMNTVTATLEEGRQLAGQMQQQAVPDLGQTCSAVGGQLASEYEAFQAVYLPSSARSITSDATTGYRAVLSSIDECGMASDANAPKQMKVALHDLNYGLWNLGRVQALLKSWSGGH
jgi:hypothetical protein